MKYKIGDIVKVKSGTEDPDDKDTDISGWQGEITEIGEGVLLIKWDNTTRNQMPDEHLERLGMGGFEVDSLYLGEEDLEPAQARPEEELIERDIPEFLDEDDQRIAEILEDTNIYYTEEKLEKYRKFLEENLNPNLLLTGSELFPWEERFFFGYGDKHEYKEMRKTRPSSKDLFRFMSIEDEIEDRWKLLVRVKRLTDRKFFVIPLCDLRPKDESLDEYLILRDYSSWITNFCDW